MKYILHICLIFLTNLFNYTAVQAQSLYLFGDKTFGGNKTDERCSISYLGGYDFIVGGESSTYINGDKSVALCDTTPTPNQDIWLIKSDTTFNIDWQQNIGGNGNDAWVQVKKLNTGNIWFSCLSNSKDTCDKSEPVYGNQTAADYWIGVCDSNGVIIWNNSIGGSLADENPKMLELPSGELLVCGTSRSSIGDEKTVPSFGGADFWCLLMDATGNILWDKVYGGGLNEVGYNPYKISLLNSGDGNVFLVGSTFSAFGGNITDTSNGNIDIWVVKLDYSGNIIWDKLFGGDGGDASNSAFLTDDNGLIICGSTASNKSGDVSEDPKGLFDYWVLKIDSLGNKQWDKRFGGNSTSQGMWISPSGDGGFWVAGTTGSDSLFDVSEPSYGEEDYWVLKIDSIGNKLWDKRFGGPGKDLFQNFIIFPDTSIMLCGTAETGTSDIKTDYGKGASDYWLVHFKYGSIPSGIPSITSQNQINVFPNPSTGAINFPKQMLHSHLIVMDVAGRVVFSKKNIDVTELHLESLPKGCYVFQFQTQQGIYNARWVKM